MAAHRDRSSLEQAPQPPHRPQVPHPGGWLGEAQRLGGLGGGEMLKVPQEHDLPICLIELLDRCGEPSLELVPGGRRRGRQLPVGKLTGEVGP